MITVKFVYLTLLHFVFLTLFSHGIQRTDRIRHPSGFLLPFSLGGFLYVLSVALFY